MSESVFRVPSPDQAAALKAYAKVHGARWKHQLLLAWENGDCTGALQQVRNEFGPSWLLRWGNYAITVVGSREVFTVATQEGAQ